MISVDGRSIVEIGPALDIALENDLLMGNSVLLEVLRETGYRDLVWIKTPRLTVAQRRYLPYYNDLRSVWGQAERIWQEIVQSYRFFLEGHIPVESLATYVREGTEELQVMRNRILAIAPSKLSGEEWEYLNSARDFMISSLFLMDQEAQRISVDSDWKVNLDGIKKRISQVEKCLNISLHYSGISRD
ncbi:hypothetical protein SAMN06275492_1133 [Dethiosulfovibrio salsuginis]|uniref:Uncharacterized protein n=1 Tax=Dethiosulfovibrio salsuginis TaxID=561720 RepID=A0A1X7JKL9_9BACT|nr:hypothetical protein SAMN06275492_1133 [Dethiosulfovibrio salsuginis]